MKAFREIRWNPRTCQRELPGFRRLLRENESLSERGHVIPLFRNRPHLAALIGVYHSGLLLPIGSRSSTTSSATSPVTW